MSLLMLWIWLISLLITDDGRKDESALCFVSFVIIFPAFIFLCLLSLLTYFLCLAYVYWPFPVYCVSFSYPVWFLLLVILSIFTCVDYFCPCLFPHLFHSEQSQVYIIAQVSHLFSLFVFSMWKLQIILPIWSSIFCFSLFLFFLSLYPEFSTPQIWIISLAASWHALCQT